MNSHIQTLSATALLLITLQTAPAALAQGGEITPFVAWQDGGAVAISNDSAGLNGAPAFGVFVTFDRGAGRKLDVVLSHQATEATAENIVFGSRTVDVSISYLHLGGRYFWRPQSRVNPYIAATVGGTYFSVDGGNALRPSGAAGGGVDLALSERAAIRLDGRFWLTLVDPSTEIACQGGTDISCVTFSDGSLMTQFALSAGVVFRF